MSYDNVGRFLFEDGNYIDMETCKELAGSALEDGNDNQIKYTPSVYQGDTDKFIKSFNKILAKIGFEDKFFAKKKDVGIYKNTVILPKVWLQNKFLAEIGLTLLVCCSGSASLNKIFTHKYFNCEVGSKARLAIRNAIKFINFDDSECNYDFNDDLNENKLFHHGGLLTWIYEGYADKILKIL